MTASLKNKNRILFIAIFLLTASPCFAQTITETQAIQCLIGEAGNQGIEGMTAVGEVLRRRGSTRGLHGCKTALSRHSKEKLRAEARQAWRASETSNLTNGADHFENVEAFGFPKWAKNMKQTVKIKNHTFFVSKY